jgi:hypothetical protein
VLLVALLLGVQGGKGLHPPSGLISMHPNSGCSYIIMYSRKFTMSCNDVPPCLLEAFSVQCIIMCSKLNKGNGRQ